MGRMFQRSVAATGYFHNAAVLVLLLLISVGCFAQNHEDQPKEPTEMLVTSEGLLAIDTPKGWVRTEGPGLAFFLREGDQRATADAWIYINSSPVGPNEDAKSVKAFIRSDIAGFRKRFQSGIVRDEGPVDLPRAKTQAPLYTFESAEEHNSFQEVVYIPENGRVLILVLDAKNKDAFAKGVPDFLTFAKSYGGSITVSGTKRP